MAIVTNKDSGALETASRDQQFLMLAAAESPNYFFVYNPPPATVEYQARIDTTKLPQYIPTKTVVISQDPAPGAFVPPGTEVKVTLASKSTLPVEVFQASNAFLGRYAKGDVGMVLQDLSEKGQAVLPILQSEKSFDSLSGAEKKAVGDYFANLGFGTDADPKALYQDFMFFNNF